jgi:osmoprotectant transport system permease protein
VDEGGAVAMNIFSEVAAWLTNPAHWSGSDGIPARVGEHLEYTGIVVLVSLIIGLPLGALVGHTGRGGFLLVGSANALRALPTYGMLTLAELVALAVSGKIGLTPAVVVLALLGIPPIMAGTYAGIRAVDPVIVDAARGVGMREWQVLVKVEIPNALPLILGGVRSAVLQVIATATVAAYINLGGLGRYLVNGFAGGLYDEVTAGAVLVIGLAIVVELVLAGVQRLVVSPGLRPAPRRRRVRVAATEVSTTVGT